MQKHIYRLNGEIKRNRYVQVHPSWYAFMKFCETLGYGEIEKLKIQDGLPMLAEEVKKKVRFTIPE